MSQSSIADINTPLKFHDFVRSRGLGWALMSQPAILYYIYKIIFSAKTGPRITHYEQQY